MDLELILICQQPFVMSVNRISCVAPCGLVLKLSQISLMLFGVFAGLFKATEYLHHCGSQLICTSCLLPGATDSVTKYFLQSQAAEARANASTTDPGSPVETSSALRQLTEDKINQTREEFLRRHTEHAQRLDDLAGELQTLDLSEISHRVGDFLFFYFLNTHTPSS